MEFNFSYASGTSLEQMVGLEMAGQIWSSYLADDVTVNVYVEMTDGLPGGVIGGALPGIQADENYANWRNKLAADRTSADDQLVYENQQDDADKFTALVDGYKIDNNENLNLSRANAKSVGLRGQNDSALDGVILLNDLSSSITPSWNYDYTSGIVSSDALDFVSVAVHELGHILGFYSGVDKPGWLTQKGDDDDDDEADDDFYEDLVGRLAHATPLDMFRYSADSVREAGSSDSWNDMSIGGNPYFSVDGGRTVLGAFATGENTPLGGDGYQASHWKHQTGNPLGIMDPVLATGQKRSISQLDIQAMDVIGWDLKTGVVDLNALYEQARQTLANRAGIDESSLDENSTEVAAQLTQDRTADVAQMVEQSQIYKWGWGGKNPIWWQNGLWQNFLAQEIDWSAQAENSSLPDSASSGATPLGNLPPQPQPNSPSLVDPLVDRPRLVDPLLGGGMGNPPSVQKRYQPTPFRFAYNQRSVSQFFEELKDFALDSSGSFPQFNRLGSRMRTQTETENTSFGTFQEIFTLADISAEALLQLPF